MTTNIFQGPKVRLRAMEARDWEAFRDLDQDTEVARASYWIPIPRSVAGYQRWAEEKAAQGPDGDNFFWVVETLDGQVVGSVNVMHCNPRMGTFSYGLGLNSRYHRQGYATEAVKLVLAYYFREMRYQKCTVYVYAWNEASIGLHRKLGFTQEGRLRRMIFTNGAYHDELVFGMTAEEFATLHGQGHRSDGG